MSAVSRHHRKCARVVESTVPLAGLIAGEADPEVLAQLAKGKMRSKIPDLIEALTGHFDADHARLAAAMLGRLDRVEAALATLDAAIADASRPWAHQVESLQTIPGVGQKVAQAIIAEPAVTCRGSRVTESFELGDQLSGPGLLVPALHPLRSEVVVWLVAFEHVVGAVQD
jgi:transposase